MKKSPAKPPQWTQTELEAEAHIASANFRKERLQEPVAKWRNTFDAYHKKFETLFDVYGAANPKTLSPAKLVSILKEKLGDTLQYMAGPPISDDDLEILADTSLSPKVIASDNKAARRVLKTIVQSIDTRRFPWVAENRPPTDAERAAAILASASVITAQRVATNRRNEGKSAQEALVKAHLVSIGLKDVKSRTINTLADAPGIGEFCGESMVGSRKADIPVRLHDGRLMPVECKVSNSSLNSVKRINNDAAVKAQTWRREFGINQVVPVAVLTGVFKVANLMQAQDSGLTLFWSHKLADMSTFIDATA